MPAALVVLSGGQDSTTCLAWARNRFDVLDAVTFDYGQRHRAELVCAAEVAGRAGVRHHRVITVEALRDLGGNAMLAGGDTGGTKLGDTGRGGLPNTFVPGRNLLFLTLAAAWAWQLGTTDLVTGVCQTDFSGYPDCRDETMRALQQALRLGIGSPVTIHTPLMFLTKAESVRLAQAENGLDLLAWTHTCYAGAVPPCGVCASCVLRAKGFAEAGLPDPLLTRLAHA
jgi:7-cyano-7-deazaguanine synthase